MIKMQIIGNLGKDATIKHLDNGSVAINFTVAHTEKFKDAQGNQKDKTVWVDVTMWKKQNESTKVAEFLKKGTQVFCEGEPSARAYTTQESSEPRASLSLRITSFGLQLLGSRAGGGDGGHDNSGGGYSQPAAPAPGGTGDIVDDLPF